MPKRELNTISIWTEAGVPGINFANSLLLEKKKSDLTFKITTAMKTETQGPIFTPFETAEIPKLDDTLCYQD